MPMSRTSSTSQPKPPRRWGLPVLAGCGDGADRGRNRGEHIDVGRPRNATGARELKNAAALGYVRDFMTAYTTLDPFNANAYADRILAQGTGDFAKMFKEKDERDR